MSVTSYSTRRHDTLQSIAQRLNIAPQDYATFVSTVKQTNRAVAKAEATQELPVGLKLQIPGSRDDFHTPSKAPVALNASAPASGVSTDDQGTSPFYAQAVLNPDGTMTVSGGNGGMKPMGSTYGLGSGPGVGQSVTGKADPNFIATVHNAKGALAVAQSVLGRNASDLKVSGPLAGLMDRGISNSECCANFVSSCLEKAGLISAGERSNGVVQLGANLRATGRFHPVSLANAKPGDVVLLSTPQHAVMFAGFDNGRPMFIGSNNSNSDGSQRVGLTPAFGTIGTIWQPN